jgi:hypothetical protein
MSTNPRNAYLERSSVVAVLIYSLLLASGLIAQVMDFPKFSKEPRATSLITNLPDAPELRDAQPSTTAKSRVND